MKKFNVYNSLTNKIEPLNPLKENEISMYVCGPTVYGDAHIGNCRPVIVFDVLYRLLTYIGYKVTYMSNITDVDDKIINKAIEEGVNESVIAERYLNRYLELRKDLNAINPTYMPRVTDNIENIINFISKLIELGYAYESNGDVFFRVNKVPGYGRLSNLNMDDLRSGARIEENSAKENPMDFALWKKTEVGIKWDTPWCKGRPGWHTECVVMINSLYPEGLIDIHGGCFDLKFPHHENEIAQSYACCNTLLANVWMHNGYINMNNVKMSKSLGNIKSGREVVDMYGVNVTRWAVISTHYRAPINFSSEVMDSATKEVNKIMEPLRQANIKLQLNNVECKDVDNELIDKFIDTLLDDLNTSNAQTVVFEVTKLLNQSLRGKDFNVLAKYYNTLKECVDILGLVFNERKLSNEDKELFNKWNEFKANKDFEKADEVRKSLMEHGLL